MILFEMVDTKTQISKERATEVCKIGQGAECCRYLFAGPAGLECGKLNKEMKAFADHKVKTGQFSAQGDNCEGVKMEDL